MPHPVVQDAGHGRAEKPQEWGASVYLQLIDPNGFAGRAAFRRQMSAIADAARASATAPGAPPVRLPGHAALLSELAEGTLSVTLGGQTQSFQITGGFVEVRNNHVRVLADKSE